ncbi:MAG: histidine kinase, partial [Bacteroidota bacterium]
MTITLWTGNALLSIYISRKVSWSERPILRTFLGVLSTSLYSTFAFFSVQIALQYLFFQQFPEDLFQWMGDHYQVPLIISLAISTVFVAVGFFKRWRESEEKADRFQAQMMTYKYEALRNQINPHFLFNSFNVLTDLVYENQDLASQFIQQLSELYRYVLDSRDKELVPIQEEIDFLNSYLFLLQIRFEQKLQVELKLEPEPDQLLVPMSLQLLIENAVKHNEVSSLNPLKVVVEQQGDSVIVRNSLNLKSVGEDSKKTGLKNIMDQYALW